MARSAAVLITAETPTREDGISIIIHRSDLIPSKKTMPGNALSCLSVNSLDFTGSTG